MTEQPWGRAILLGCDEVSVTLVSELPTAAAAVPHSSSDAMYCSPAALQLPILRRVYLGKDGTAVGLDDGSAVGALEATGALVGIGVNGARVGGSVRVLEGAVLGGQASPQVALLMGPEG